MNIKDVETLTGITKQNIRFYEKKGLLRRNETRKTATGNIRTQTLRGLSESKSCAGSTSRLSRSAEFWKARITEAF